MRQLKQAHQGVVGARLIFLHVPGQMRDSVE